MVSQTTKNIKATQPFQTCQNRPEDPLHIVCLGRSERLGLLPAASVVPAASQIDLHRADRAAIAATCALRLRAPVKSMLRGLASGITSDDPSFPSFRVRAQAPHPRHHLLTRLAICLQAVAMEDMTVAISLSMLPRASSCARTEITSGPVWNIYSFVRAISYPI